MFKTFSSFKYLLLAIVVAFICFLFILWLPNLSLIISILFSSELSFLERLEFFISSFAILKTNFDILSAIIVILISLLIGMNVAMIVYYFSKTREVAKIGGIGFLGLASSLLGIGCLSCGSILISVLGLSGAVLFLPFDGIEFHFLSITLLLISLYFISKKISKNNTC